VIKANPSNFRLFGPDETASNRLGDVFEVTSRAFDGEIIDGDNDLAPDGRVMEVLSELATVEPGGHAMGYLWH